MPISVDTIFCDDVRSEANGKLFIIGAYTSSISSHDLTVEFYLTLLVRFHGIAEGTHESTMSISFNGKSQHDLTGTLTSDGKTATVAVVNSLPLQFNEEGILEVFVTIDGGEQIPAGSIPILKNVASTNSNNI